MWAVCLDVTAFCGRAVLQWWNNQNKKVIYYYYCCCCAVQQTLPVVQPRGNAFWTQQKSCLNTCSASLQQGIKRTVIDLFFINDLINACSKDVLTGERMVSLIVFVNPPLVLSEYLQSLVEVLHAVRLVVLQEEDAWYLTRNTDLFWYIWSADSIHPTSAIHDLNCSSCASANKW